MKGTLYLIPNHLGGETPEEVIPDGVLQIIRDLDHFIVENVRTARRFLIKCQYNKPIDDIHFYTLNKHTPENEKSSMLAPCEEGNPTGIISEAGLPGIADPGSDIVRMAHRKEIKVVPLTGPSSILLGLIASGLNGQEFHFHGYLPVKPAERKKKIRQIEADSIKTGATQVFIEAPYRNHAMLETLMETCQKNTLVCIACDLTTDTEMIKTRTAHEWKKERVDLYKRPSIFMIGK